VVFFGGKLQHNLTTFTTTTIHDNNNTNTNENNNRTKTNNNKQQTITKREQKARKRHGYDHEQRTGQCSMGNVFFGVNLLPTHTHAHTHTRGRKQERRGNRSCTRPSNKARQTKQAAQDNVRGLSRGGRDMDPQRGVNIVNSRPSGGQSLMSPKGITLNLQPSNPHPKPQTHNKTQNKYTTNYFLLGLTPDCTVVACE
jgi:hypothetical protein